MASTDQRAGFRLPWSGPTPSQDADGAGAPESTAPDGAAEPTPNQLADGSAAQVAAELSMEAPVGATPPTDGETAAQGSEAQWPYAAAPPTAPWPNAPAAPIPAPERKPARFVTELVRAMRAELDKHRETTVEQFRADAKAHVETVHARSAEEVTELRRMADDDAAGIREWSKAEIARIRAETDERIEGRKVELEGHLEEHAALIEREIEKVQARVNEYEAEVDRFFRTLDTIDDPAAFAAAAQQVPEPPSLEAAGAEARSEALADLVRGRHDPEPILDAPFDPTAVPEDLAETGAPTAEDGAAVAELEAEAEAAAEAAAQTGAEAVMGATGEAVIEPEAAARATVEAQEPALEQTAEAIETTVEQTAEAMETTAEPGPEYVAQGADMTVSDDQVLADDPRLAALAPGEEVATAESRAADEAANTVAVEAGEPFPEIEADIVAARLNGLVPEAEVALNGARPAAAAAAPSDTQSTQVIVVGLVSVASIASFKRQLSRLPGVHSVGVSSGPDGEFIFKANHDPTVALDDVLPTLSGYGVRIVSTGDGIINVSARDPEN